VACVLYCPLTIWAAFTDNEGESQCSEDLFEAERLLLAQGYWPGSLDGCPDEATNLAILAFRRAHHLRANEFITKSLLRMLRDSRPFRPQNHEEPHLEINVTRRIMYWVTSNGDVQAILPISIGSGASYKFATRVRLAITPSGSFTVYHKIPDWHYSPLGLMYYSSFINGGIAIHGSRNFSTTSQTHGCIGIPLFAATKIYNLLPVGTKIIIYSDTPRSKKPKQSTKIRRTITFDLRTRT
jgi:hypothetical protein